MMSKVLATEWTVLLGAALIWYSSLACAMQVASGRIRPAVAPWCAQTTTSALALASAWNASSTTGVVITAASCLRCAQVLIPAAAVELRERRRTHLGDPPLTSTEQDTPAEKTLYRGCLIACVAIAAMWSTTENSKMTLLFSIAVNAVASIPTIRHGWRGRAQPKPFVLCIVGAAIALLSTPQASLPDYGWTLYQFSINVAMLLPPMLRGWSTEGRHSFEFRPGRLQQAIALTCAVALLTATSSAVLGIIPLPRLTTAQPALSTHTEPGATQDNQLTALSVSVPARAAMIPTISATISVPSTPGYVEMAPDGRHALIAHRAANVVSVLDTSTRQITAQISTPAPPRFVTFCPTAEDRTAGRAGDRAYVSMYDDPTDQPASGQNRHLIGVIDTAANKMITTIPVSARPFAPACSPDGTQLWVPSHDDARVDVIDTATGRLVRSVPVPRNPHWVIFSADGRKVYIACHDSNVVAVIDPTAFAVSRTVAVGASPHSEALSPDGRSLAVVNFSSSQVSIIDTDRDVETRRIAVGEDPQDVAWSADGKLIYTVNVDGKMNGRPVGNISVVDATTGGQTLLVTHDPSVDSAPTSFTRSADGSTGYITNLHSATLTILDLAAD